MSRFFTDIEEEKKEIRKNIAKVQKQTEKKSKKEKLMEELETRINECVNTKNIKKLIADLKKYDTLELPMCLQNFLKNEKVYSKNKKQIDEYLSKFAGPDKQDVVVQLQQNVAHKEPEDLEAILAIKDMQVKIQKLQHFLETTDDNSAKADVLTCLLSIYTRNKNTEKVYDTFMDLMEYYDNKKAKTIIDNNMSTYLDLFCNTTSLVADDRYTKCLEKIKSISNETYERRTLDLHYNTSACTVSTDNHNRCNSGYVLQPDILHKYVDFRIREYMRLYKLQDVLEAYKEIDFSIKKDGMFCQNIYHIGRYLFSNKQYYEAFICYNYVYENGKLDCKLDLYALCVIMNKNVKSHSIFKTFISEFKSLQSNPFVLKSSDKLQELFRSFYFLHNYDINRCYEILHKVCPVFNDIEILKKSVVL